MSRINKPLPGVAFNYEHPLCPLSRGGAVLPLNEGSGPPRLYLPTQQYTVASTTTERLCTFTNFGWSGYASKFGGPTVRSSATNGILNCGVHTDFLTFTTGTIIIGYKKVDANDRTIISTSTNTLGQFFEAVLFGGTGKAQFLWGGNVEGTSQLTSATGLTLGDDVWAFSTGPRGMEIYQNGSKIASNTASPTRSSTFHDLQLGVHAFWNSSDLGDYSFVYCYPDQLTVEEIRAISLDPFCFYDWGEDQIKGSELQVVSPVATLTLTGSLAKTASKGFASSLPTQGAIDCGYPDTWEANPALQIALRSMTIAHWPNTEADLVMRHLARKQREHELDLCVPISLVNLYRACGLIAPSIDDIVTTARREGLAPEGIGEPHIYGGIWPIDTYYLLEALGFPYRLQWVELSRTESMRDVIKPLVDSGCRVLGFFDRVVEGPGPLCNNLGLDSEWERVPFYSGHCGLLYETAADYVKVLTGDWNEPVRPLPWLVKFSNQTLASVRMAFRPGFVVTEPLPPVTYPNPAGGIWRAFEQRLWTPRPSEEPDRSKRRARDAARNAFRSR